MKRLIALLSVIFITSYLIHVSASVTSLDISQTATSVVKGEQTQVSAYKVIGSYRENITGSSEITYTSSDESVASVNENGLVTGVGSGLARIDTVSGYGSASVMIIVYQTMLYSEDFENNPPKVYSLATGSGRGGSSADRYNGDRTTVLGTNGFTMDMRAQPHLSVNTNAVAQVWFRERELHLAKKSYIRLADFNGTVVAQLFWDPDSNQIKIGNSSEGYTYNQRKSGWRQIVVDTSGENKANVYLDGKLVFAGRMPNAGIRHWWWVDAWADGSMLEIYVDDFERLQMETPTPTGNTYSVQAESAVPSGQNLMKLMFWEDINNIAPQKEAVSFCINPVFYVSPWGSDSNDGNSQKPFATLQRAKEAVIGLAKNEIMPLESVTIKLSEGDYYLDSTFFLAAEELLGIDVPVIIEGEGSETVLKGSLPLEGSLFEKVTESEILAKIPLQAQNSIYRFNLFNSGYLPEKDFVNFEIIVDGKGGVKARYPNSGYSLTGTVASGEITFGYSDAQVDRWAEATDLYLYGLFGRDWSPDAYKVESIDTTAKTITLTQRPNYGIKSGDKFFAFNLLEELDMPGEWFYDKQNGELYVYSDDISSSSFEISMQNAPLVKLLDTNNVIIRDMSLCNTYSAALFISGGSGNKLENCLVKNTVSGSAVIVSGGTNNGVYGCEIYDVGSGGISLSGGDRQTLTPAGNYAVNNRIYDYQRITRSYRSAIGLSGVGNRVANNEIFNGYHLAIQFIGNDHIIEYNEIHNVCRETSDMGAIYSGRDWTRRGNVIRYNYFHDITGTSETVSGMAIYLDDGLSGTAIHSNVFRNTKFAVYLNGGRDTEITNNIIINRTAFAVSDILNWSGSSIQTQINNLAAVPYDQPPYTKYPNLANILDDQPRLPKYNRIEGNVIVSATELNLAWLRTITSQELRQTNTVSNMTYASDPGFADMANHDYTLLANSPVFTDIPGFVQIPMDLIGYKQ